MEATQLRARARRILRARSIRLLVLLALLGWGLARLLEGLGGTERIRSDYGLAAAAFLVPVHAVVAVSPAPSEVLALAYGAIYGFGPGCLFAWLGWMLGACLEYGLFRGAAAELGDLEGLNRLPSWVRRVPVGHPVFLIVGRWFPFGNHLVNAAAGVYQVPFWRFTWASALALIPASLLITALATGMVAVGA